MSHAYIEHLAAQNLGKLSRGKFSTYSHRVESAAGNGPQSESAEKQKLPQIHPSYTTEQGQPVIVSEPKQVFYPGANFDSLDPKLLRSQLPVQIRQDYAIGPGYTTSERQKFAFHSFGNRTVNLLTESPPGLEFLATLDRLHIKQSLSLFSIFTGCETENSYKIYDGVGHELFNASEQTPFLTRICCGSFRPFRMCIKDCYGQDVIELIRPLSCGLPCVPCCFQSLQVFAPAGNLIGSVQQVWNKGFGPGYVVRNHVGKVEMKIQGPAFTCSCFCRDVVFEIISYENFEQVGKIVKTWSGIAKELFTDADNFAVTFPIELDVKMKATLLGACLLIDYMFFERRNN